MKPQFSTLIILTLVCAVLMVPFTVSPTYLDMLRDRSFDLHQFLRGKAYNILLWSFFGVTLTALLGVVAETGILKSPRKIFNIGSQKVV